MHRWLPLIAMLVASGRRHIGVAAAVLVVYASVTMVVTTRLLPTARGGASIPATAFPTDWGITKFAGNPVIDVDDNPAETREQYDPYPIQLPNGDIWVYVKGTAVVYAWRSTDGGETFSLENGGDPVLDVVPGGWELGFVLEPVAIYDEANDTIHLYYKGRDANPDNWQWGHATASGSDPTTFTRDPANPIYSEANADADIGGTLGDFAISDVIVIDGVFHFYGYGALDGEYCLLHATGTTWNDPSGLENILDAPSGGVVSTPAVVRIPGSHSYAMFYSYDPTVASVVGRSIRVGSSPDGVNWSFSGGDIIAATTGWEDDAAYAGHFLRTTAYPFDLPIVDEQGRWKYYYSGEQVSVDQANAGLAYLEPS